MKAPKASRPKMPAGYQIRRGAKGLVLWRAVNRSLTEAHNYWVGTCRPDGRPHAMPVWGVWIESKFFFATDRKSRKSRNLERNPAVVIHLESGDNVVILEGVASHAPAGRLAAMDDAYLAKYGMRVCDQPGDHVYYEISPTVVFAWQEKSFPSTATRWKLG